MDAKAVGIAANLRRELDEAGFRYRQAVQEYKKLLEVSAKILSAEDPGLVDGTHAMGRAFAIHRRAREEYERALRKFTDFVLYGKKPDGGA
jgi:hypothetical protein